MENAIAKAQSSLSDDNSLHGFLRSDLGVQLPLHVSLSAPLVLRTEQRADFQEALEIAVRNAGLRSFNVKVVGVSWEPNLERTRWFLVMRLTRPDGDELNKLLTLTNRVVYGMGLPMLYQADGSKLREEKDHTSTFHVSIAWRLEEPTSKQKHRLSMGTGEVEDLKSVGIRFDNVKVKIGSVVHDMHLPKRRQPAQGFGEV